MCVLKDSILFALDYCVDQLHVDRNRVERPFGRTILVSFVDVVGQHDLNAGRIVDGGIWIATAYMRTSELRVPSRNFSLYCRVRPSSIMVTSVLLMQ